MRRARSKDLKDQDCDPSHAEFDEAEPLTATEALVILSCSNAAYQGNSLAYRVPRNRPEAARLLVMPAPPTQPRDETPGDGDYVDPEYDPQTAVFASSAKGRGLADCGASTEWTFDGRDFHVSAFAEQARCGGAAGDWPTVYRTRAVRSR